MPRVGMFERRNQFFHRSLVHSDSFRLFEAIGGNPKNPATIVSAVQIEKLFEVLRQGPGMLDNLPMHIDHVKRSVGRIRELHRAKPGVSRSGELNFLLSWPAL